MTRGYHMIRIINRVIFVTALLISCKGFLYGQGEDLFDDSFLHEIHFFHMDTSLLNGSKIYQRVDMSIYGHEVDSIGIKEKGNMCFISDRLEDYNIATTGFPYYQIENGNGVQYASSYPLFPERIKGGCIAGKNQAIDQLKNYYLEAMCELVHEHADTTLIFNRIDILVTQIKAAVYSDYRKLYSDQEFDLTTEYGHFTLDYNEFEGLKTFFSDRYKLIKEGLKNENFHCGLPGTYVVPEKNLSLTLYPCPSTGMLNMESEKDIEHISVLDIYGKHLVQLKKPGFPLDISYLLAGTYIISVSTAEGTYKSKFILN